jgi:chromosome segregation ATPase
VDLEAYRVSEADLTARIEDMEAESRKLGEAHNLVCKKLRKCQGEVEGLSSVLGDFCGLLSYLDAAREEIGEVRESIGREFVGAYEEIERQEKAMEALEAEMSKEREERELAYDEIKRAFLQRWLIQQRIIRTRDAR